MIQSSALAESLPSLFGDSAHDFNYHGHPVHISDVLHEAMRQGAYISGAGTYWIGNITSIAAHFGFRTIWGYDAIKQQKRKELLVWLRVPFQSVCRSPSWLE